MTDQAQSRGGVERVEQLAIALTIFSGHGSHLPLVSKEAAASVADDIRSILGQRADLLETLKAERDWHEMRWDFALDAAREETVCGTKAGEQAAMRTAAAHSDRMGIIDSALSKALGQEGVGENG